jgi:hypothetical protein
MTFFPSKEKRTSPVSLLGAEGMPLALPALCHFVNPEKHSFLPIRHALRLPAAGMARDIHKLSAAVGDRFFQDRHIFEGFVHWSSLP